MIRVVPLRKAAAAGAAGALAWELALRALILAGLPLFDIVRQLGTLPFPSAGPWVWWPAGMAAHALVGIGWTVFYAYFFWARLNLRPALQGLVFAAPPAALAILVAVPQLTLMHIDAEVVQLSLADLVSAWTPGTVGGLLLGHAIFGLTAGALYTRPVGYPAGRPPRVHMIDRSSGESRTRQPRHECGFIFATGIECSYPTVENGQWRNDALAAEGHYRHWERDFELARQIGVTHLRYGPPLHLLFRGPGQYDWSVIDQPMAELERFGPEPMVDLCHFGLPAWLGDFQNPDIAPALAEYARAFAERYRWVRFYTPVNEMYVCARYSALQGLWNEQRSDEQSFATAVVNLASASVAMTDAILSVRPDAILVNSESSEFAQPSGPDPEIERIARFENERRFLPLDLIYAHAVSDDMRAYLRDHGVADATYDRFMGREVPKRSIIGLDYYEWNEKLIDREGNARALGELFGWYVIASQYHRRYRRVMMHTETNRMDAADAPRWLWRQWHNVQLFRQAGAPLVGFTWYSLTDQIDWNNAMAEPLGAVYPVGLFDLNRDPRAVGLSYKYLIQAYAEDPEYRDCGALKELMG